MSISPASKNAEAAEAGHHRQAQDPPQLQFDDDTVSSASSDEAAGETHSSSIYSAAFARVRAIAAAVWTLVFARAIAWCCGPAGKRRNSFDVEDDQLVAEPPYKPTEEERARIREERLAAVEGRMTKDQKKAMRRKKNPAKDQPLRGPLSRNAMRWNRA